MLACDRIASQFAEVARADALPGMLASIVHMHANRTMRADALPQEYVLYEHLRRHCRSAIGRARRDPSARHSA